MPEKANEGAAGAAATACVDRDGDGYGNNCTAGRDCDDTDPANTTQCFGACSRPSEGCECLNDAPVPCFLDETANADGTTMCHEGTRHCRNGLWGACGDVHSYSVVPRQDTRLLPDVVRRATCSDCELNCFVARDPLTYVDGGLGAYADMDIEQMPGNGLTIRPSADGGIIFPDSGPDIYRDAAFTQWPPAGPMLCPGPLDNDCDNVPDNYDIDWTDINRPFWSLHTPIVLTTPSTGSVNYTISDFQFRLPAADVYFMLDVTRNQNVERLAFINAVNDLGATSVTDSLVDDIAGFGYNCVDSDGDGNSINENAAYKTSGLLGAIRCFTGDPNYGVGFMDEVPVHDSCSLTYGGFLGFGATTWTACHFGDFVGTGVSVGEASTYTSTHATVPFRNLLDLNPADAVLRSAVWRLPQIATRLEIPQAGTQALWALSAGGAGDLYYGPDRPAFGARRDCPAGTWGGACFRSGVLPITFMFTDTGQHNGPLNYLPTGYKPGLNTNSTPTSSGAPYIANNLTLGQPTPTRWGTPHAGGWRAQQVLGGETEYTATQISATALVNQRLTITGSTIGMASNLTPAAMGGCGFAGAPDAFFGFTLPPGPNTTVSVGLVSTLYDSDGNNTTPPGVFNKTLSLFSPPSIMNIPITMGSTSISPINGITPRNYNDDGATSYFTAAQTYLSSVSRCGAHGINGVGIATNERRITFTPTANMTLLADVSGSGTGAVIDLYQGTPPANPTLTASGDTNDEYLTARDINATATAASPGYQSFSGNTSAAGLPNPIPAADLGCGFDATTRDAVYGFHLDNPSTVTIDTEGSSIDTVLSLHTFATIPTQTIAVNDATADTGASGFQMGSATGYQTTLTGSTAAATANFLGNSVVGASCLGPDTDADHLIEFTLATPSKVRVREAAGGANPPVAIFNGVRPPQALAVNAEATFGTTGITATTAYDFDTLGGIQGRVVRVNNFTTSGKVGDYPVNMFTTGAGACIAASTPSAATNEDAVFHFNSTVPITGATFRIDGLAPAATRPMIALFNNPLDYTGPGGLDAHPGRAVTLSATTTQLFSGTTDGMASNYSERGLAATGTGCGMTAGALDVVYTVTVPPGPAMNVTFRAESTSGLDPVLRLFPERSAGVAATPWVNATLTATDGASGGFVAVTGTAARFPASGSADLDSYPGASAATTGCVTVATSRDVFFPISLASTTTLDIRATTTGDSTVTLAVYPAAGPFNVAPTTTATSAACVGVGNTPSMTPTLNAGNYYVVLKANRTHPSPCGGFLQPGCDNRYQDDNFYVEITDASTGASSTFPQAQLQCDDNSGGGTTAQFTRSLNPGTYDLVVTGKATAGSYKLSMGPSTVAPVVCSTTPTPTGSTAAVGVTAANANSTGTASGAGVINVQNAWVTRTGNLVSGGFTDTVDLPGSCITDNASRDAFFRLDVPRTSHLVLTADSVISTSGCGGFLQPSCPPDDTELALTIVNADGVTIATQTAPGSGAVACNLPNNGVQTLDVWLPTGTYYAVVKASRRGNATTCGTTGFLGGCTSGATPTCPCSCGNCGPPNDDFQDDDWTFTLRDVTDQAAQEFTTNIAANTDYYLVAKGINATPGTYNLSIGAPVSPVICVAPNATGTALNNVTTMPAGTHYALIKGGAAGAYSLDIIDQTAAESFGMIECNDNAGIVGAAVGPGFLGSASRISRSLAAGDYKVVVKGRTAAANGAYRLNIRDNTTFPDNSVACAAQSGTTSFSAALTAGQPYTAIIKGQNNATPAFSTLLSDPSAALVGSCYTPGTAVSLPAGNHVIGLKGNSAGLSGSGAFQMTVEAGSSIPTATTAQRAFASKAWPTSRGAVTAAGMKVIPMQSCEPLTDWGTGLGVTTNTGPGGGGSFQSCGFYFSGPLVGLMGVIVLLLGWIPFFGCLLIIIIGFIFALFGLITMTNGPPPAGSPTAVANDPFACNLGAVVAGEDSAAADALFASVQSPLGTSPMRGTWPQSKQIASDTGTLKADGTPIAYWLRESPSSDKIAYDIAHALYRVTEEMTMDVSLQMQWGTATTPMTNPGYGVAISGVAPTDCISVAGAIHRDCSNGDRPAFDVTFSNPPQALVPQNTAPGWFGAWPGRLVVLGDGQFVLDEIPVLLIPPFPPMMPPIVTPSYSGPATYYQDIGTRECDGTTLPDWTDLYFNAEMPPGTRIVFESCAGDSPADVASCTMLPVTTVTATNVPCADDSACRGINGYCGSGGPQYPGGYCQILSPMKHKGLCSSEAECPDGVANGITAGNLLSDCNSGECEYDSQPADVGTALGSLNFRRWSRMRITLHPDPDPDGAGPLQGGLYAPNLLDWAVTYVCTPNQ